jgi:hypothetical protein
MGVTGRRARRGGRASGDDMPHEVLVEIERLVIDGIDALDRDVLGRAVEAELAGRLALMERAAWGGGVAVDRLGASADLGMVAPGRSWTIGSGIAASVHGAVAGALPSGASRQGSDG